MGNQCCAGVEQVEREILEAIAALVRKARHVRARRAAAACRRVPRVVDFSRADLGKWTFKETPYGGSYYYHTRPEIVEVQGLVEEGVQKVKERPDLYDGVFYDPKGQSYSLVKRTGSGFRPKEGGGWFQSGSKSMVFLAAHYQVLPPDVDVKRDAYTDSMTQGGHKLGEPVCPGRGDGVADVPTLCIVRDADPSDIAQGCVGDCWLLSAISALAEYDGAIATLFRKTPDLQSRPHDGSNTYIVTLWDVATWKEVDIEVDERLCTRPGTKALLGARPSVDGELWVCYLEKAVAAHCGGWDKIDGGTCAHAFRILLGCKEQYTFREQDGQWMCLSAFNPNKQEWEHLANSPHDGFRGLWPSTWPEVGGGGSLSKRCSPTEMFLRMCQWEDAEFIMGCGTKSGSDSNDTEGIVDGHAYTILACENNVAGSGINMVKVRNPWGQGEFRSGKWDDNGPGWSQYPEIKDALNPAQANDGVFWLEQEEFFKYFKSVYLCAMDMSQLIG
mmetsp:Transcript_87324/g.170858  ORF Transcript_87324/g.170858 Transcript_87324/m.170858 type:complete len:501 (-) Transcript_87324:11-1513(-)